MMSVQKMTPENGDCIRLPNSAKSMANGYRIQFLSVCYNQMNWFC